MGQSHSDEKGSRGSSELTSEQKDALTKVRAKVAAEIYESEKVYVKRLDALIRLYKKPLQRAIDEKKPIVGPESLPAIFANVEEILSLQERILYDLEGRINKWSEKQIIGDIFVDNASALKLYTEYINNYDNALSTIRTLSKENSKFKAFLKENITREDSDSQDIHSLLICVVQRPPRYCLLLRELLKNTPDSHKDKRNVSAALEAVEKAAEYINTQKMIAEGRERCLKIKNMFQNKFNYASTTGPKIYYEGEIKLNKTKKCYCVIFSDYLLLGEEKTSFLGKGKSKYEPIIFAPLSLTKMTPASETQLVLTFERPRASTSVSAPSSPTPEGSTSSSSAPASPNAPTTIISTPTLTLNWENHEALQAWMAIVAENTANLKSDKATARNSFFGGLFKW